MPRDLVGRPAPANAPLPKRFVPVFLGCLADEPKNPAKARKLLEEILTVDPSREDARNALKTTSP